MARPTTFDLMIANWLEPEKPPEVTPPPAHNDKKKFWEDM